MSTVYDAVSTQIYMSITETISNQKQTKFAIFVMQAVPYMHQGNSRMLPHKQLCAQYLLHLFFIFI